MTPAPGDLLLDRYLITARLGEGGMGFVLAADDRSLGRRVALKFLLPAHRDKPHIVARFEREARNASLIEDPHVAAIYTVERTPDGTPFLVMEYLDGDTFAALLRARGPFAIHEAVDCLLQACEAIADAHKRGIIHRDLKPANMILTRTNAGIPIVKVLDFGIAKAIAHDETDITKTGALVGSPSYMSPEQLQDVPLLPRSDVWSLGVILYELLAGVLPFRGTTISSLTIAITKGEYAELSTLRADIPEGLDDVIAEAICTEVDWRLPTVEAFAAKLAPFGTDQGRASYERIRLIAATPVTSAAPTSTSAPKPAVPTEPESVRPPALPIGETSIDKATSNTKPPPAPTPPPRGRLTLGATLGSLAGVVVVGAVVQYGANASRAPASATVVIASTAPSASAAAAPPNASDCDAGATAGCEAACAAHVPGSCGALAKGLAAGVGAPKDAKRAATLFQADCDAGSGDSCNRLGGLYDKGDGVPQSGLEAFGRYQTGCTKGSAAACVNQGSMEWEGTVVPRDLADAASRFDQGCEGGEALGCLNVSVAYHDAKGVPKDFARSYTFAQRACSGGELKGCTRVAVAQVLGEGTIKDVKAGLAQLDALCQRGETWACEKAAGFASKGAGPAAPADRLRVGELAKTECAVGKKCGMQNLEVEKAKSAGNAAYAWGLFQSQCDAGTMSSCRMLGEAFRTGSWGTKDVPKGDALVQKACKGGDGAACKEAGGAVGK